MVARAAAADPVGHRPRRPDPGRDPGLAGGDGPAAAAYAELAGKTTFSAREQIVAQLRASGDLDGEPRPTQRMANFYEKGDKPLEIVTSRQWYIRNGGRDEDLKAALVARGHEITWVPAYMQQRFENWINGLNGDWLISRQRFFGVPFPVWYAVDAAGETDYATPLFAPDDALPVDPSSQTPPGYAEDQRGQAGGFVADPDVMDTWATSSLTPQIVGGWTRDEDLFARVFPMDLRPQAPRHHPDLAVLHRRALAPRARRRAVEPRGHLRLRRRPGPQEDEQVQGQRDRARPTSWSSTAPTPCAGGRPRPARARTARSTRPR